MASPTRPVDLSKFRKSVTKSIAGISSGFSDPTHWVDTGSYTLNYMISGDFFRGIPLGKVTTFAGQSGSGKSYLASANIVRNALKENILVIVIDSEHALDKEWLRRLGVDPEHPMLEVFHASLINDVAKIIHEFVKQYKEDFGAVDAAERPPVLFVIDSLGALLTPHDVNQFQDGDMKGNMGHKAKQLKALIGNCVNMFGDLNIGMVATNHTYASQDMYNPDDVIAGGSGFIFLSSVIIAMKKAKLKEDEDGNKVSEVTGIRSVCKLVKNRFNPKSLHRGFEIKIPFNTGLDPYSGLFELFEQCGLLKKEGNRYAYTSPVDGTEIKEFRKNLTHEQFDKIMHEFGQHSDIEIADIDEAPTEEETKTKKKK